MNAVGSEKRVALLFTMAIILVVLASSGASAAGKWNVSGYYVEGCSCMGVCPCELTGLKNGCEGVGAYMLTSGSYQGGSLSGAKVFYAAAPGQWVRLYIDAKDPKVNKATREFASAFFSSMGKIEDVKDARIAFTGKDGNYTVSVDDGATALLKTEPVLGGDKKTPIAHTNIKDPLNPTVMQGKTISCSYKDGEKTISLEGSNSYFNQSMKSSGMF